MHNNRFVIYIAYAIALSPIVISADDAAQQTTLADHVKNQYLFSMFGKAEEVTTTVADPNANFIEKFKEQINAKTQLLTPREAQDVAFNLVSSTHQFDTQMIDSSCIDKLELVGGGENNSQLLFNNVFGNIHTAVGQAHAALTLCNPITDVPTLINRQKTITYLKNNEKTLDLIDFSLTNIASSEIKTYGFWHSKPMVNQELIPNSYLGGWITPLKQLNTNPVALEIYNRGGLFSMACSVSSIPAMFTYRSYQYAQRNKLPFGTVMMANLNQIKLATTEILKSASLQDYAILSLNAGLLAWMFYGIGNVYLSYEKMYQHMQDILINTACHIKELQNLSEILTNNPEILELLPSLQSLADFNNPAKQSAKLNKLLGMLDTNTFKGEPSCFSLAGRTLAAYELMKQVKDELAPVCAAAGELDMYVALAKLYSNRERKEAQYCMVNFIENSTTPLIKADKFWNAFIDADKVIVNDITFDSACPNTILTGPNTGGKSTVIKALMIDILMAQTFGIAAAQSFAITSFSKLNCFMNISDDIATGASLFKSEVMRAKKLLELVQSLKDGEFSFVIIDEVFTGTSPQEGEAAALQFSKKLGSYNNNISIIATHYPKMVNLEKETNGRYRNHHLEILRNQDGSLNRTFKLKNGPTFMNVAFDILEEEGLFI